MGEGGENSLGGRITWMGFLEIFLKVAVLEGAAP
jgi:hypothetical protein